MIFSKLKRDFKKNISHFKLLLTLTGWQRFFRISAKREKNTFLVFFTLFLASSFYLFFNFYLKNTLLAPAQGGTYVEGVVGQPRFINPIYARVSDTDQDLTELIFSGLMKYDSQGKIVPDLAKNYEIKEEGKVYDVELKEKLFWSDGIPLTAADVVFTVKTIQNSDYKSPLIANWLGVEIEKISDSTVRFTLKTPYGSFLENLTQKIIPEHIWKDVTAQNFPLSVYNLKPIGSGPYKLKGFKQDKKDEIASLDLVRNPRYHGKTPYLSQLSFRFFNDEKDLIKSYKKGDISGFSLAEINLLGNNNLKEVNLYSFSLPRYFAVFFNPEKSKILADQNIRLALNYGTNKGEIIEKVLSGYGKIVQSPILPEIYGFSPPLNVYQFDKGKAKLFLEKAGFKETENGIREKIVNKEPASQFKTDLREGSKSKDVENLQRCLAQDSEVYPEGEVSGYFGKSTKAAVIKFQEKYAEDILDPWGLKEGTGIVSKGTRDKLNVVCFPDSQDSQPLKFSLTTVNQPVLISAAELLKEQWKSLGIEIEIKTLDISQLEKDIIKKRDYESLLFGEVLSLIPDPFPFWHSTQKKDPGLNLAIYQNKKTDKLLEDARQTLDEKKRKEKLEQFQNLLIEDSPAMFLYNPNYLYFISEEIKGTDGGIIADPSKRFIDIENWYINSKRVFK